MIYTNKGEFMDFGVFEGLCKDLGLEIKLNESMKKHSGFKTGGDADIFVNVKDEKSLACVLETANALKVPLFILGKGSNLLVSDRGIEGAVISLSELNEIDIKGNKITAEVGASLTALCVEAANAGLSGLEFAYGIPGSVGGAVFMNAGAYGGEICDVIVSAEYLTQDGKKGKLTKEQMELGYRKSAFMKNGYVITKATFSLKKDEPEKIWERMNSFMERRKAKQPLEYPSGGSTFKRPEGYYAGALIEENGLKGFSVGGAEVSEKHAGFVINKNNATTDDILELIEKIKLKVNQANGVTLETEVIFVGRK